MPHLWMPTLESAEKCNSGWNSQLGPKSLDCTPPRTCGTSRTWELFVQSCPAAEILSCLRWCSIRIKMVFGPNRRFFWWFLIPLQPAAGFRMQIDLPGFFGWVPAFPFRFPTLNNKVQPLPFCLWANRNIYGLDDVRAPQTPRSFRRHPQAAWLSFLARS